MTLMVELASIATKAVEKEELVAVFRRKSKFSSMVKRLGPKLISIQALLNDAEQRQIKDKCLKKWLADLKDLCYDIIDVIEEGHFVRMKLQNEKKVCLSSFPLSLLKITRIYMVRDDTTRKIRDLVNELGKLDEEKQLYGLALVEVFQPETTQTSSLVDKEIIPVRNSERETLREKLLNESRQEQGIYYLFLVGMGGMGKTALAKSVYDSSDVKRKFECRGWISVSAEFNLPSLVKKVIESVTSKPIEWNEVGLELLIQVFRGIIGGKRYLLVLDDVSDEDESRWKDVKRVFDCGARGSVVLVISHSKGVARAAGSANTMDLNTLSEEDSWLMFRNLAFGEMENETSSEDVGRRIVRRCHGVPLSIKAVAGVLRTTSKENSKSLMEKIERSLESETSTESLKSSLMTTLMLSYCQLFPELRQCLLYCSIFPKNHPIDVHKLIKLWMAQSYFGNVREGQLRFEGLLRRSLLENLRRDDKGNLLCNMNGALTEFIQELAINECCVFNVDQNTDRAMVLSSQKGRHWTLNVASQASLPIFTGVAEKVHTLMIISVYSFIKPTTLRSLLRRFKRLRALDLSHCLTSELPPTIGKLLHLRYLDFSFNCDLKKLPEAICDLSLLQTLNLNGCDNLQNLPNGIRKLIQLRHLEILWTKSLSYLPNRVRSLTSLQTLNRFFGSGAVGSKACDLGDLGQLCNLGGYISIDGLGCVTDAALAEKADLKKKENLHGVDMWFSGVASDYSKHGAVLKFLEPPPNLKSLGIFYYMDRSFPDWMIKMKQLRHLMLSDCGRCETLPPLGKLPMLESLEIRNMINVNMVGPEFLGIEPDHGDAGDVLSTTRSDSGDGGHKVMPTMRASSDEGGKEVVSVTAGSSRGKEIMPASNDGSDGVTTATGSSGHGGSNVVFPELKRLQFHKLTNWEEWGEINGRENITIMPKLSSLSIVKCTKLRAVPGYIKEKKDLSPNIVKCPLLNEEKPAEN